METRHRPPRPACVIDPLTAAINDLEVAVSAGARFIDADTHHAYLIALRELRRHV